MTQAPENVEKTRETGSEDSTSQASDNDNYLTVRTLRSVKKLVRRTTFSVPTVVVFLLTPIGTTLASSEHFNHQLKDFQFL
ncbi:unnamed protein product [Caenorhabditis auriculariae]|uniref:Uncharacterized protein n=1 Tax=Caenorhabditis auriculariae TaxID=2777116 RepID=A0A8S1H4W2_9PELO|nr:unnamed protein product [Caenorhabditis auriculariae]